MIDQLSRIPHGIDTLEGSVAAPPLEAIPFYQALYVLNIIWWAGAATVVLGPLAVDAVSRWRQGRAKKAGQ